MRSIARAAAAFLSSLAVVAQQPARPGAELHIRGATVWTGTNQLWGGDLDARYGKITRTRTSHDGALAVDLGPEAFVVPGLQDAHGHLLGLGGALVEVDLVGTRSYADVIDKAKAAAAKLPKGSWVVGRGWDQNDWPETTMPAHRALSAAVPDHPVWLVRVDGHAGLANSQALQLAGIGKDTESPAGGEILRDSEGLPTGVLVDAAMAAVPEPALDVAQVRERLLVAHDECLRHGLTCVHDAGVSRAVLDAMVALHGEGRWGLRTYVMLAAGERELIARGPWQTPDGLITVRAVKGYADGALGSRGAVLLEPYADRPAWKGLFLTPEKGIAELAQRCAEHGMQLCTHAIGDAANRAVLDAYAAVQCDGGLASRRFRVEHAQVIAEDDFARFRSLGVLPSMQPTHLTSDMPWAPQRLGPARTLRAYAYRRFHALGLPVPFGSDFPVESVDPRKGFYAAATTRAEGGDVELRPDQKLSRAEVIRGFTAHAAYGMFAENVLGTIEADKLADFTVFDRSLLTCSDAELLTAKVLLTVIGGRVVYDGRGR
ncbi:MAG: amidohydrolase [Planctomycetes bacterium]|nr:amidohydrolase [Planctomycetota bacterium]